jgi:hypothetical protein
MVNAVSTVIALAQIIAVLGAWQLIKILSRRRGDGEDGITDLMTGGAR